MTSLQIKRIFLSFAQNYFRDVPTGYTWNRDPRLTGIFIGDKFSAKVGTAEKYPAIILTSGTKRWAKTSIDQRKAYPGLGTNNVNKVRSDLVLSSVVYQCLSENGVEANTLADILFHALVAYKDDMRNNGIHQIMDVQLGEEQLIRSDNVARAFAVPVMVSFAAQTTLVTGSTEYSLQLYTTLGNSFIQSLTGITDSMNTLMYSVSGQYVVFNQPPPSGLPVSAQYIDSITLDEVKEVVGTADGVTTIWALSNVPYNSTYKLQAFNFDPIRVPTTL